MQEIRDDIKSGNFKQVYVLYGEEDYLVNQFRDQLVKALTKDLDSMNISVFNEDEPDLREIASLSDTLPFFADRRVIVINSRTILTTNAEELAEAIERIPDTTYFVFATAKVDKRTRLYKAVSAKGTLAEYSMPNEAQLKQWIGATLRRENLKITNEAADLFLAYTGSDMQNMYTEMEKLICYAMGQECIVKDDVEMICIRRVNNRIFDMIDAIGSHQTQKAIDLYYDLLALKEPPMRILSLLGRHFNRLLSVRELRGKGYKQKEIADKMELKDFVVRKLLAQAADFSEQMLRSAVEACAKADEDVKSGRMTDRLCVEMIIVKYSAVRS